MQVLGLKRGYLGEGTWVRVRLATPAINKTSLPTGWLNEKGLALPGKSISLHQSLA
jgi:hypothetical protein